MAHRSLRRTACTALLSLSLASCESDDKAKTATREVEIHFDARIGDAPVRCGRELPSVGENQRDVSLVDLRFYVHDVKLIDARGKQVAVALPDDGLWQSRGVALLDLTGREGACRGGSEATNAIVRGMVPEGEYKGLSFKVGVPFAINHGNQGDYSSPLSITSLYWDWKLGFIFFKLDLEMAATASEPRDGFQVHLGSQGCTERGGKYACPHENVPSVRLDAFNLERDKVVLDLKTLLRDMTVARRPGDTGTVPGCAALADDPDCAIAFPVFGLSLEGGPALETQTAFGVGERADDDLGRSAEGDGGSIEEQDAGVAASDYELAVPTEAGFARPLIPADNPLSEVKIELGRHLFYDKRLSGNLTQSCASCHKQELAFTDGRAVGLGSTGESHVRGAMSLANVVYATTMTWANPDVKSLEDQAHTPIFGKDPVELGLRDREDELIERLRAVPEYQRMFPQAFPGMSDPFTVGNVQRAIASFERTLISGNSPYDRYVSKQDLNALSESAKRGMDLFFDPDPGGNALECFHCHGGATFSDQVTHARLPSGEDPFHNTGLYDLSIYGSYVAGNEGLYEHTHDNNDRGRFKAPTLRNIAVTAPYMHDGSIATLEEVVAHYARGGRLIESGPNAGDGRRNRNKSTLVHGFNATPEQRADLIAFLRSLTDDDFLKNPKFADPW